VLPGRLLVCICLALTGWVAACGSDYEDASSSPDVDLATDAPLLTIVIGEGDIGQASTRYDGRLQRRQCA
jgi:hypothetical protein